MKGYLYKKWVLRVNKFINLKTEVEILKALSINDTKVYELLYAEYFNMAKFFILKNNGDIDEAKDVFQDAIIVLYQKTKNPDFKLTCTIKTYLYSIVRNLWLKVLAKKKKTLSITDFEQYYKVEIVKDKSDENQKIDKILLAIKQLGEKCRLILTSFYFEKKKMDVIAEELGYTNAKNAKNQKYKCMQQVKKIVKA